LDTFAIATALGTAGFATARRRITLLFVAFEAGMPLIGIGIGQALGLMIGSLGDYLAGAALLAIGAFLLRAEENDADTAARWSRAHGIGAVGLGLSISLDELAIGFSAGLLHLPLAWTIVLVAGQAFLAVQLGLRLGRRLGERIREAAERLAGVALIALGIALIGSRFL
jgi:putative Mn2+ efflux pump MntP